MKRLAFIIAACMLRTMKIRWWTIKGCVHLFIGRRFSFCIGRINRSRPLQIRRGNIGPEVQTVEFYFRRFVFAVVRELRSPVWISPTCWWYWAQGDLDAYLKGVEPS